MSRRKSFFKGVSAILLALLLVISLSPMSALADETDTESLASNIDGVTEKINEEEEAIQKTAASEQATQTKSEANSKSSFSAQSTRDAIHLRNVITDINYYNYDGIVKLRNGVYNIVQNANYRFELSFDLTKYDNNLANGDYFTFTIPEIFKISKTSNITLTDSKSEIEIGLATIVPNENNMGGTATVKLQNLDKYLEQTGGDSVSGITGTFYIAFTASELQEGTSIKYNAMETADEITHKVAVIERTTSDYSDVIGKTNFSKVVSGTVQNNPYTSEALGKSGDYVHLWRIRTNVRQESYETITVTDEISMDYAPMQIIPESLEILYGYYNSNFYIEGGGTLVEGKDYTIEYNSTYTAFTIEIKDASSRIVENGKPAAYHIRYNTTSPADGSQVSNTAKMSGDGQPLTISTNNKSTESTQVRDSKIIGGGTITIDTSYRIVVYKVDANTLNLR